MDKEYEMDNQQVSSLEGIKLLAKNAKFGDGNLWKHPECINYKICYTSITKKILQAKINICPSIFGTGIYLHRKGGQATNYTDNAKPLYGLCSFVHPVFNEYANKTKEELIPKLTITDFALWYLDDGCAIKRNDGGKGYRFYLCIGNSGNTKERRDLLFNKIHELFGNINTRGNTLGRIVKNNSKATENNKTWTIPKPIAKEILKESRKFCLTEKNFLMEKPQRLSRKGVGN